MSGASATEYPPQVAALMSASRSPQTFPERLPPEPAVTSTTPPKERAAASQKLLLEPLDPDEPRDQRGEDRKRAEEQRDGRRRRQVEREDEAELVQEQEDDRPRHERQVPPLDPQRALAREDDREEDQSRERVADGRVRERPEAVVEDVLRDGEVERPEADGHEQHRVCHRAPAHDRDPRGFGAIWLSRRAALLALATSNITPNPLPISLLAMAEPTQDDVDAIVGPATPHFAYQLRARVLELVEDLPEIHEVRRYAEEQAELLDRLGYASSKAEEGPREPRTRPGWETIPSAAPADEPLPANE